ncbi:ESCRT-II subunit protein VPS25 NDAI_0D00430 [Naumovozyma dairenensis CBS 421]|uniref:ESCRT-II complex subunit VPS25 n=1 Tax=Naumovozyma dairenensis (strain ATCC 10597 / BCRC 20456 / CBS 421 / NBRC 0211 / NRRL Y-12639) TaxID=1071378 RepID=G0W996_NAUDC|nr:hypothetical protein NDAI_0D00430 [Naumovozyma dairenensis CBS 421]CCD24357.1 hypothetical protein NDAI_0D00430 [Naumovozyma dairenensis CBS 421]
MNETNEPTRNEDNTSSGDQSSSLPATYSFPPLYTRQPNVMIRKQQINAWIDIILQFAQLHKYWIISQDGTPVSSNLSIFNNESIQRSVPQVFIDEIWSQMIQEKKALPVQEHHKNINQYFILWKDIQSWASIILQWFEDFNKLNQVVTIYELSQSDETMEYEFHQMPESLLKVCLKPLCKRNRATMLNDEHGTPIAIKVV